MLVKVILIFYLFLVRKVILISSIYFIKFMFIFVTRICKSHFNLCSSLFTLLKFLFVTDRTTYFCHFFFNKCKLLFEKQSVESFQMAKNDLLKNRC